MEKSNKSNIILILIVLIIVGAVMYVAIPLFSTKKVTNTISEAKETAYKMSAQGIIDYTKLYYTESKLSENFDQAQFDGKTNLINKIRTSGEKPESGLVYMNENQEIYIGVVYENVCFSKDFKENEVTKKDMKYCSEE